MIPNFKAHPWHGISAGEDAPNVVNVFVELFLQILLNMK
jgi:inorganic pyrophosphatase